MQNGPYDIFFGVLRMSVKHSSYKFTQNGLDNDNKLEEIAFVALFQAWTLRIRANLQETMIGIEREHFVSQHTIFLEGGGQHSKFFRTSHPSSKLCKFLQISVRYV